MVLHEGKFSKDCCISCFNVLVKGTDRNLVNGKNKVVDDLNDLTLVKCLTLVKKRASLKEKLKDIGCCLTSL